MKKGNIGQIFDPKKANIGQIFDYSMHIYIYRVENLSKIWGF